MPLLLAAIVPPALWLFWASILALLLLCVGVVAMICL
jgi:hypothetical protein